MLALGVYMSYQAIMFSAAKTLSLINYLTTSQVKDDFNDALIYYDVKKKIAKIHMLFLGDFNNTHPSIHMAINDIKESIDNINQIIEHYINAAGAHNLLYFKSWRPIDTTIYHKNLLLQIHLLEVRFDDLNKIIQILKYQNVPSLP